MKKNTVIYIVVCVVFLFLANAAYINYAFHANQEYRFTGANSYTGADKLVYMSMVEQGRDGILFMKNLHTTEPQTGLLFSPHWYIIGQTAKLFHVSNNFSYQVYRILGTIAFLVLLYVFLQKYFLKEKERILSSIFILFSGGIGWFVLIMKPDILALETSRKLFEIPTDIYVTEGNTLLNFNQSPLFIISQLFILYIFYQFVRDREKPLQWIDILNALLVSIIVIIHPYDLPIILTMLGAWTVWQTIKTRSWASIMRLVILCLGAGVGLAYNLYTVVSEPVLSSWLSQNLVFSPPIQMYLWGYGLLVPFWVIGVYVIMKEKKNDPWWVFAGIWSGLTWILLYIPLDVNRRFTNAFHIALALVAYRGFKYIYDKIDKVVIRFIYVIGSYTLLMSGILFYLFVSLYFSPSVYTTPFYYISTEQDQMISYLREHTTANDGLLTTGESTSFIITSQLNRAVYRGHDHQTPHADLKEEDLIWFFSDSDAPNSLQRKKDFLSEKDLHYVIVDTSELDQAAVWFTDVDFLTQEYSSENLIVYRVL